MGYDLFGRLHAALAGLRAQRGQGTVEYVGLVLLMSVVLAAIVAAAHQFSGDSDIPGAIVDKLKGAIDGVKDSGAAK